MKIGKLTLILILSIVVFTSCSNNDDSNQTESMDITWNLKNVSGGFAGVDVDYQNGMVTWQFVHETGHLIVVSSVMDNSPQSDFLPLQSGTYNYNLMETNGKTYIAIEGFGIFDNGEYGRYIINNDEELVIDQGEGSEATADDVFILQFD